MPPDTVNTIADATHFQDNQVTQIDVTSKKKLRWYETETPIVWRNVIILGALHAASAYYYIMFPYLDHKLLLVWTFFVIHVSGLGITAGVHRLWTHRTYKAKIPARILLAILFYTSGQNSIYDWVRDHRLHHKYSDTAADPHDNSRGIFFSHIGWLLLKKKDIVRERGKKIDMSDVQNDPVVKFFDGNFVIMKLIFSYILPIGLPVLFLNQEFKWTFIAIIALGHPYLLNATWAVNSIAHKFGHRSYNKAILPSENLIVSFLAGGEGWHNYHHVFPWDYKTAEHKHLLFNPTSYWIDLFVKLGWASDLKYATPDHIKIIAETKGDNTHPIFYKSIKTVKCS